MNWVIEVEKVFEERRVIMEGIYEAKTIELPGVECRVLEPIRVKIVVALAKDGIAVGGYVKTVLEHPCDRCLKPVQLQIHGTIEALYKHISEAPKEKEEELQSLRNVLYYSSDKIDLSDRIIEAIIVDVPMRVLCKPDCKGLCPHCGADLNEDPNHSCREYKIDPRLSKLLLLSKKASKEG
ncbi:MAG TPA: DUF177 domain-containing protein [Pseudothermotoga sp.]|nr:DUF177 domain-containing protein [Pseudothermotoga sp.]HOK83451.1 DUF177 domain-containing protein [Pseudothermotoga sp.]HPP69524.1 DUF177 domain-containing protein [Pseudothermotoga sp.]